MDWMVSNSSTHKNEGVVKGWDVRSLDTVDLEWVLDPDNGNIYRVFSGDNVLVYSYDDQAFTHIGVFMDMPYPDGVAPVRLMRLNHAIPRSAFEQLPEWRTPEGNPRTPFSRANTFSQPVNITDRWTTVWGALIESDQARFRSLWSSERVDRRDDSED